MNTSFVFDYLILCCISMLIAMFFGYLYKKPGYAEWFQDNFYFLMWKALGASKRSSFEDYKAKVGVLAKHQPKNRCIYTMMEEGAYGQVAVCFVMSPVQMSVFLAFMCVIILTSILR